MDSCIAGRRAGRHVGRADGVLCMKRKRMRIYPPSVVGEFCTCVCTCIPEGKSLFVGLCVRARERERNEMQILSR